MIDKFLERKLKISPNKYYFYFFNDIHQLYSNLFMSVVYSYYRLFGRKPSIAVCPMISSVILDILRDMEEKEFMSLTYLSLDSCGRVKTECIDVLDDNCCLVVLPCMNESVGSMNDLAKIQKSCIDKRVPLLCQFNRVGSDFVQGLSLMSVEINETGKMLLIIDKHVFNGRELDSYSNIFEYTKKNINEADVKGIKAFLTERYKNRVKKKKHLKEMMDYAVSLLKSKKNVCYYADITKQKTKPKKNDIIVFGETKNTSDRLTFLYMNTSAKKDIKTPKGIQLARPLNLEHIGLNKSSEKKTISINFSPNTRKKDITLFMKKWLS